MSFGLKKNRVFLSHVEGIANEIANGVVVLNEFVKLITLRLIDAVSYLSERDVSSFRYCRRNSSEKHTTKKATK